MKVANDATVLMTQYKQWADALFFATVAQVSRDDLVAPRPIFFGSLLRTLNHSCAMDYVWQCHLLRVPHGLTTRNPEFCPEFDILQARQAELDAWYVDYSSGLRPDALDEVVEFTFIGGNPGRMSRRDILLHVVNHCTYHRGHAADMLYTLGIFPPTTDLPVFVTKSRGAGVTKRGIASTVDPRA